MTVSALGISPAAAAVGVWSTTSLTIPADAEPGSVPVFSDISCVDVTDCLAVGEYQSSQSPVGGVPTAFLEVESGGVWSQVDTLGWSGGGSSLSSVSCPVGGALSDCVAVGSMGSDSNVQVSVAIAVSDVAGTWTPTQLPDPLDSSPASSSDEMLAVACAAVGWCTAVGWDDFTGDALVETLSGGSWSADYVSGMGDVGGNMGLSCPTLGLCFENGTGGIWTGSGGNWTDYPDSLSGYDDEYSPDIDCTSDTSCTVAQGAQGDASVQAGIVVETLSGGSWTTVAYPAPDLPSGELLSPGGAPACSTPDSCVVTGDILSPSGGPYPNSSPVAFTVNDGTWGPTETLSVDGGTTSDEASAVWCVPTNACEAVGQGGDGLFAWARSPDVTAPDAPAIGTASVLGACATVPWTVGTDGGDPITSFTVTTDEGGQSVGTEDLSAGVVGSALDPTPGASDSAQICGLTGGETYTFTVGATTANGPGPPSAPSNPVIAVTAPGVPAIGTALAGTTCATAQWTVGDDGGEPITSFTIDTFTTSTAPATLHSIVTEPSGAIGSLTDPTPGASDAGVVCGLVKNHSYFFDVTAANAAGSGATSATSNVFTQSSTPQTVTSVTSSGARAAFTQCVTFTATVVVGGGAAPTGGIKFSGVPGSPSVTPIQTAEGDWSASTTTCTLGLGDDTITATYSGAGQVSSNASMSEVIVAEATETLITVSGGVASGGTTNVTGTSWTAEVSVTALNSATAPTGKVTVYGTTDRSTLNLSLVNGQAAVPQSDIEAVDAGQAPTTYELTATYLPSTGYVTSSTTSSTALTVGQEATTLSLGESIGTSTSTFTATLSPDPVGTADIAGTISFVAQVPGKTTWSTIGTAPLSPSDSATLTIGNAVIATYAVFHATYDGTGDFASSTSENVPPSRHWGVFTSGNGVPPDARLVSPTPVSLPGTVVQVASSNSTEYALLANGSVYAWGLGGGGELGDGGTTDSLSTAVEVQFPAGVKIAELPTDAMPYDTGLAIDTEGRVWGWGLNLSGELCLGNAREYLTPTLLPFTGVTAAAGAGGHSLFDSDGTVYACGDNNYGDLGDGSTAPSNTPVVVQNLPRGQVSVLVASWSNSGALLVNGTYLDWGFDGEGQLGTGTVGAPSSVPVTVPLPLAVTQVAVGGSDETNGQTLVMLSDGSLRAWGDDANGQLGDGGNGERASPIVVSPPNGVTFQLLATGGNTSYGVSTSGVVYSWGDGGGGQIGNGLEETELKPVAVESGVSLISATAEDVVTN
ncbi:MAG: fibronectin type III domain-containing protein [Acidimicrobiales bacterium]